MRGRTSGTALRSRGWPQEWCMMEFRDPGCSGSAVCSTAGAGVSSGTTSGSGSCFLLPLTLMTVSTVACMSCPRHVGHHEGVLSTLSGH